MFSLARLAFWALALRRVNGLAEFKWNDVSGLTTCQPADLSWVFTTTEADDVDEMFIKITNVGVAQEPTPSTTLTADVQSRRRDDLALAISGTLNATAQAFTWPEVNVTAGFYILVATFPDNSTAFTSHSFAVSGTDTSCGVVANPVATTPKSSSTTTTTSISSSSAATSASRSSSSSSSSSPPRLPTAASLSDAPDPSTVVSTQSSSTRTLLISGIVSGVAGAMLILLLIVLFLRRRPRNNKGLLPMQTASGKYPRQPPSTTQGDNQTSSMALLIESQDGGSSKNGYGYGFDDDGSKTSSRPGTVMSMASNIPLSIPGRVRSVFYPRPVSAWNPPRPSAPSPPSTAPLSPLSPPPTAKPPPSAFATRQSTWTPRQSRQSAFNTTRDARRSEYSLYPLPSASVPESVMNGRQSGWMSSAPSSSNSTTRRSQSIWSPRQSLWTPRQSSSNPNHNMRQSANPSMISSYTECVERLPVRKGTTLSMMPPPSPACPSGKSVSFFPGPETPADNYNSHDPGISNTPPPGRFLAL
ncbi:hypothetical protein MKEN_00580700 [Mycena kentingensis (nom. inval.)]|nr:hypothetical protein MKEN_00580700 [Mycena kentingensis (nom. inval.)]